MTHNELKTAALITSMAWLAGCTPAYVCPTMKTMPVVPGSLVTEAELRAEWTKRFGALPSPACDAIVQWAVKSDEQTQIDCMTKQWGYKHVSGCRRFMAGTCPVVTVSERAKDDRGLRYHEWAHWALQCVWIGTWRDDNTHPPGITAERWADPYHTIQSVWGPGGFVETGRAQQ